MAQPTVAAYFNTRKRIAQEHSVDSMRTKVLILENPSSLTSNDSLTKSFVHSDHDVREVAAAGSKSFTLKNVDSEAAVAAAAADGKEMASTTRRVTRASRIRRIGAVDLDEKTMQQKLVSFVKRGNLSPKKRVLQPNPAKMAATPEKAPQSATQETAPQPAEFSPRNSLTNAERGMKTPTKQKADSHVKKAPKAPVSVQDMPLEEIRAKLLKSSKLTEMKTALNKYNQAMDKLRQLQKTGLEQEQQQQFPALGAKNLKQFSSLEIEVPVSPQKAFKSPTKSLHRTPANACVSSPEKPATPKKVSTLMSPIKDPSTTPITASPKKIPAYQRLQALVEPGVPSLLLPYKYRVLAELFKCVDTVCAMFYNRKEQITFKKLKPAVQRMSRKNFHESHLAQIKTLYPDAFILRQELTKNYGSATKHETYQLVIKPNVKETTPPANDDGHDDDGNVLRAAQNQSMNPEILVERCQHFTGLLLDKAKDAHHAFLLGLDPPMKIDRSSLRRWHPQFDLESCPDVAQSELPTPPNVERFSSAKDVLSTARNLFNCGTAMERALEKIEQKKKEGSTAVDVKPESDKATVPVKKADELISAMLKNVPKSLLEKVRAKQAAKALDQMTRRPSHEKEAIRYGRLPELARHLRNVFVTEKKNVLPLEATLVKIENSYRGKLAMKELEEHLRTIAQLVPFWFTLPEVRKTKYAKMAKDCSLAKVIEVLENKANEAAR